ncbi:MAG: response regulator [Gemmatimonadales bacterium]
MKRILVIEDDPHLRKVYVTILGKEGFEVVEAVDGKDGLRLANEREPDLILLDMMMPTMNGIDFLKAYDVLGKHPNVKVLAFSATEKADFQSEAARLGATKYMTKFSVSPKKMAAVIRQSLDMPPSA